MTRADEMNAQALAENIAAHREETGRRLAALENEISSLKTLVQRQSQVVGDTIARMMGSGSTVENPEDN